jgi:polyisoprenoid-binding protein YceI
MRAVFKFVIFVILFLSANCILAADNYTLDPKHTYVLWHIDHFGFSHPSGKWQAEGNLVLDDSNPQNSKVSATIHTATITTGVPDLDEHLKSPLFFDVTKFPTASFVSDKVMLTGKTTARVHGTLTLHGISKPLTLEVKLNKMGPNPITDKMSVGFTASTMIERSDFGINTLLPGLGDDVRLDIEAEASKQ